MSRDTQGTENDGKTCQIRSTSTTSEAGGYLGSGLVRPDHRGPSQEVHGDA